MVLYPKYFPVAGFTPLPNLMFIRKNCRLKYEVEAYRAQIAAGAGLDSCAAYLAGMYYLGIDFEQARCLLR